MAHPDRGSREGLAGHARLFFALWPPDDVRAALHAQACVLQAECGGRVTPADKIHLTLVFLGEVPGARVADLCRAADKVTVPSFGMDIGIAEYWRHNRIVWAGPQQCPDALRTLVAGLESAIAQRGFPFDSREHVSHITLLRDARCTPESLSMKAIHWPVSGFVLLQSVRRDRTLVYEVLRHWRLGAATRIAPRVAQRPQDD